MKFAIRDILAPSPAILTFCFPVSPTWIYKNDKVILCVEFPAKLYKAIWQAFVRHATCLLVGGGFTISGRQGSQNLVWHPL